MVSVWESYDWTVSLLWLMSKKGGCTKPKLCVFQLKTRVWVTVFGSFLFPVFSCSSSFCLLSWISHLFSHFHISKVFEVILCLTGLKNITALICFLFLLSVFKHASGLRCMRGRSLSCCPVRYQRMFTGTPQQWFGTARTSASQQCICVCRAGMISRNRMLFTSTEHQ